MKRVSDLGRVGQRVVEGLAIRARQVQRRRLDAIPPGLRAGGEPVRGRLRAAALDNIEELRWPSDINNRRHPRPVAPRPGAPAQGLVETDRADRPEPPRILNPRSAVGADRGPHTVTIAPQPPSPPPQAA